MVWLTCIISETLGGPDLERESGRGEGEEQSWGMTPREGRCTPEADSVRSTEANCVPGHSKPIPLKRTKEEGSKGEEN